MRSRVATVSLLSIYSGPPEVHFHEAGPASAELQEDDEPFPRVPQGYENGEVSGSESEEREEEEGEEPPPIPPRGKSLSPDTKSDAMMNAAGKGLIKGSVENGTADHFLGGGRGDGRYLSPLSSKSGSAAVAPSGSEEEEAPPPIPEKSCGKRPAAPESDREAVAEEEALLSELDELTNMLAEHERRTGSAAPPVENEEERTGAPPASQDREM